MWPVPGNGPNGQKRFYEYGYLKYNLSLLNNFANLSKPTLSICRRPLEYLHKNHKRQGNFHSYIYLGILEKNTVSASGCRKSDDELSLMDQEYLPMDDALQPLQPLQPLLPLPRHSLGPALWSYLADRPANLLLARRKPDSDTLELAYDYEWACLHLSVRTMLLSLLCTNSNTLFSYCYPCTSAFFQ